MTHEQYKCNVWQAVGQWLAAGRDYGKLHGIAQEHDVLAGDVEDMLADCLD